MVQYLYNLENVKFGYTQANGAFYSFTLAFWKESKIVSQQNLKKTSLFCEAPLYESVILYVA